MIDNIIPELREFAVAIDDLNFDPDNTRTHDATNEDAVRQALAAGQNQLLVAQKKSKKHGLANVVRIGNCRLKVAKEMGWTHVAVLVLDIDDNAAVELAIADNRAGELGEWDRESLASNLQYLAQLESNPLDLSLLGWEPAALGLLDDAMAEPPSLHQADEEGHVRSTRDAASAHKTFQANEIRQVMLHYRAEDFDRVAERLAAVREALGVDSNSEAVEKLLSGYLGK